MVPRMEARRALTLGARPRGFEGEPPKPTAPRTAELWLSRRGACPSVEAASPPWSSPGKAGVDSVVDGASTERPGVALVAKLLRETGQPVLARGAASGKPEARGREEWQSRRSGRASQLQTPCRRCGLTACKQSMLTTHTRRKKGEIRRAPVPHAPNQASQEIQARHANQTL